MYPLHLLRYLTFFFLTTPSYDQKMVMIEEMEMKNSLLFVVCSVLSRPCVELMDFVLETRVELLSCMFM